MRNLLLFMVVLYFFFGCIFICFVIMNVIDIIWNMWIILFVVMVIIDFNLVFCFILVKFIKKK